jgi:hypothetical protein
LRCPSKVIRNKSDVAFSKLEFMSNAAKKKGWNDESLGYYEPSPESILHVNSKQQLRNRSYQPGKKSR